MGPFYSYATGFSPPEMRRALEYLQDFIKRVGPFDGVFGFSLGASLAIAYLLEQQQAGLASSFRFAVLFSPIFIASADDSFCETLLRRLLDDDHAPFRSAFPRGDYGLLLEDPNERVLADYLGVVLSLQSMGVGQILPNTNVDFFGVGDIEGIPRLVHPTLLEDRIQIPTVYVMGQKDIDSLMEQSKIARKMCVPSLRRVYNHDGGHDVPFKRSDVKAIVSSIRAAADEARL